MTSNSLKNLITSNPHLWLDSSEEGIFIKFDAGVTHAEINRLLATLMLSKAEFCLYDAHYPSPSDPGAYISYSQEGADPNCWSMTLGNHGWSGGIYQIQDTVICNQLFHLLSSKAIDAVQLNKVSFFSHYKRLTPPENRLLNDLISKLHTGKNKENA